MSDELEPPPDALSVFYEAERSAPRISALTQARLSGRIEGALSAPLAGWTAAKIAGAIVASFALGAIGGVVTYATLGPERVVVREVPRIRESREPAQPAPVVTEAVTSDAGTEVAPVRDAGRPPQSTLAAERRLLDAARAAQARGRHEHAERALATHRRRFARGALAEERDALQIELLAAQGRIDEARSAAAQFSRAHPQSLYESRIRRVLGARERTHEEPSAD